MEEERDSDEEGKEAWVGVKRGSSKGWQRTTRWGKGKLRGAMLGC